MPNDYSWLIAPGDGIQSDDYNTPTRVKIWLKTIEVTNVLENEEIVYGQWLAQLLDNQLGTNLVDLYHDANKAPAFTFSTDALAVLRAYFTENGPESNTAQSS